MSWICVDDQGRPKKMNDSEVSIDALFKENERLHKENEDLLKRSGQWCKRAFEAQSLWCSAEDALKEFEHWWRLPNDQRTIRNIENAMIMALDCLDKIEESRKEKIPQGCMREHLPI